MDTERLREAVEMSIGALVLVATADAEGRPHLAAARTLERLGEHAVAVSEWFCPRTVENLRVNRQLSITVWDPESDRGYQLLGELQSIHELDMIDGYAPGIPEPSSQVERQLRIDLTEVLEFRLAPHTDKAV